MVDELAVIIALNLIFQLRQWYARKDSGAVRIFHALFYII